jgi:hypothetical protein
MCHKVNQIELLCTTTHQLWKCQLVLPCSIEGVSLAGCPVERKLKDHKGGAPNGLQPRCCSCMLKLRSAYDVTLSL